MSLESYFVYLDGKYTLMPLRSVAPFTMSKDPDLAVWSARLSTGLLGFVHCPSGNRGPKNRNEVLLAVGKAGLGKLVDLGFITCPTCHPEKADSFWEIVKDGVQHKYGISGLEGFTDRLLVPFDARRVNFEEILLVTGEWPSRLYVPPSLSDADLKQLKKRFGLIKGAGKHLPSVGHYNHSLPSRFTTYQLDSL